MDTKKALTALGFGKNAYAIYAAIFTSKKPSLIADISQRSGLARQQVYRDLPPLLKAGYITELPLGKRMAYVARSPRRIETSLRSSLSTLSKSTERIAKKRERELPAHITYYQGFDGIRAIFDDAIEHTPKGDTFYRYTSERDLAAVNRYLSSTYRERRDRKKLERLVISNPASGRQKRPRLERFVKYIDPAGVSFEQNIIQLVYGKRLAFINLTTEEAFTIEDTALAEFQKVIFQQLYRRL